MKFDNCKKYINSDNPKESALLIDYDLIYRGEINDDGLPHGNGKVFDVSHPLCSNNYIEIDGTRYYHGCIISKGKWNNGKLSGYGIQKLAKNIVYMGNFKYDKFNGKGTIYKKNEVDQYGIWLDNDIYNGYGRINYLNGDFYKGYVVDGKRCGSGILCNKNREELLCGNWINDNYIP